MENFTEALRENFGIEQVATFQAEALYLEDMDCVEYLEKDVKVYAKRIDNYLTLSYDRSDKPVGFVLKGFRNYYNNNLRDLYDFTGEDFISLMDVILLICKEKSAHFKASKENGDIIGNAYRQALQMSRENKPRLNIYSIMKEAA